jgi:hypothetical protein
MIFLTVLLLSACTTSSTEFANLQPAFTSEGDDVFVIRLESQNMSEKQMNDALLFHSARRTIDSGRIWFVVESIDADRNIDTENVSSTEPDIHSGRPTEEKHSAGVSLSRSMSGVARVRMFSVNPNRPDAREASRVIEEIGSRQ